MTLNADRIRPLREAQPANHHTPVVFWVQRDRRVRDNWALLHAQHIALERKAPLRVVFCLVPEFLGATIRQYDALLKGLEEFEHDLHLLGIGFDVLTGSPPDVLPPWLDAVQAQHLITDFEPLRIKNQWLQAVVDSTSIGIDQVDAHNVVPVWIASQKREFGAYTLRPKIHRLLPTFLEDFPAVRKHPFETPIHAMDWQALRATLRVNTAVEPVSWFIPGERAGRKALDHFMQRLALYGEGRNDPNKAAQSGLSPWFHFGQLAPQRAALAAREAVANDPTIAPSAEAFLEELIVRRELADNFTFTTDAYDAFEGFPDWAQQTLNKHRSDQRDYVYSLHQWERAETHDPLWNAAQREMMLTGKMHGYMRMYWAKKILEWSESPEEALSTAIVLNDRYELDGRDPNGYCGIAWSIGGLHDRAWFERPVYGKIRYMNSSGAAKKFDVPHYIARFSDAQLSFLS
jgi:deoxyribodipyrimidine photo-lyase